jgi:hypothetical protein
VTLVPVARGSNSDPSERNLEVDTRSFSLPITVTVLEYMMLGLLQCQPIIVS